MGARSGGEGASPFQSHCARPGPDATDLGALGALTRRRRSAPHTYLDISDNQITGTLPPEIFNLTQISGYLALAYNSMSGTLPSEVGALTNLRNGLCLSSTHLGGPLPTTLGLLTSIVSLGLENSRFDGSVPSTLGNLSALTYLNLAGNQLTGSLPASLQSLSALTSFSVYNNPGLCGPKLTIGSGAGAGSSYPTSGTLAFLFSLMEHKSVWVRPPLLLLLSCIARCPCCFAGPYPVPRRPRSLRCPRPGHYPVGDCLPAGRLRVLLSHPTPPATVFRSS